MTLNLQRKVVAFNSTKTTACPTHAVDDEACRLACCGKTFKHGVAGKKASHAALLKGVQAVTYDNRP